MIFPFRDNVPTRRTPVVTYGLIVLNVAVWMLMVQLPAERRQHLAYEHGFVPLRISQLFNPRPITVEFQYLQQQPGAPQPVVVQERHVLEPHRADILLSLLTTMYMHGSWLHLLGNMWFLLIFGNNVEDRLGHVTYFVFYMVGGLLATACHWWNDPASSVPVIGASGAIGAVLGAYAITWPWSKVRCFVLLIVFFTIIDLPALVVLGFWFLGQVWAATSETDVDVGGGVAFWAHIGGFVAGMFLMLLLREQEPPPSEPPQNDDAPVELA